MYIYALNGINFPRTLHDHCLASTRYFVHQHTHRSKQAHQSTMASSYFGSVYEAAMDASHQYVPMIQLWSVMTLIPAIPNRWNVATTAPVPTALQTSIESLASIFETPVPVASSLEGAKQLSQLIDLSQAVSEQWPEVQHPAWEYLKHVSETRVYASSYN